MTHLVTHKTHDFVMGQYKTIQEIAKAVLLLEKTHPNASEKIDFVFRDNMYNLIWKNIPNEQYVKQSHMIESPDASFMSPTFARKTQNKNVFVIANIADANKLDDLIELKKQLVRCGVKMDSLSYYVQSNSVSLHLEIPHDCAIVSLQHVGNPFGIDALMPVGQKIPKLH